VLFSHKRNWSKYLYTQSQRLQTNLSHSSNVEMCYKTRGVTRWGKGGTIPRAPNHYGGAESQRGQWRN